MSSIYIEDVVAGCIETKERSYLTTLGLYPNRLHNMAMMELSAQCLVFDGVVVMW